MVHNSSLKIEQSERLSFSDNKVPPVIYVKQYERLTRKLRFVLLDGKTEYEIPSSSVIHCSGVRPDGKIFEYATIDSNNEVIGTENNRIVFVITEFMTDIVGRYPIDIILSDNNSSILRTFSFTLSVEPFAAKNAKALARPYAEAIQSAKDNILDVFITENGYFAMNTDDGTQFAQGSESSIINTIHDEMVTASIDENGRMKYQTEDSYGFEFGMDHKGRTFVKYGEG